MSPDDITKIIQEMKKDRIRQAEVHKKMSDDMAEIKAQLSPIVEVYSQFQGFGSIVSWVFKFVIIPISILIGIWISIKQLK